MVDHEAFLCWLKQHGALMAPLEWPASFPASEGGRGLGARRRFAPGSELLAIPRRMMLFTDRAVELLGALGQREPYRSELLDGDHLALAACLLAASYGSNVATRSDTLRFALTDTSPHRLHEELDGDVDGEGRDPDGWASSAALIVETRERCAAAVAPIIAEQPESQQQGVAAAGQGPGAPLNTLTGWAPYAATLPPGSDFDGMPALWPAAWRAALGDPHLQNEVKETRAKWQRELRLLLAAAEAALSEAATPAAALPSALLLRHLNIRDYLWSRAVVSSRCFIDGHAASGMFAGAGAAAGILGLVMVPFADMLNHTTNDEQAAVAEWTGMQGDEDQAAGQEPEPEPPMSFDDIKYEPTVPDQPGSDPFAAPAAPAPPSAETSAAAAAAAAAAGVDGGPVDSDCFMLPLVEGEKYYLLRATSTLEEGQQVTISYGEKSGTELLDTYGFRIPAGHNPNDALHAPVLLPQQSPLDPQVMPMPDADKEAGARPARWAWPEPRLHRLMSFGQAELSAVATWQRQEARGEGSRLPAATAAGAGSARSLMQVPLLLKLRSPAAHGFFDDELSCCRALALSDEEWEVVAARPREGAAASAAEHDISLGLLPGIDESELAKPVSILSEVRALLLLRQVARQAVSLGEEAAHIPSEPPLGAELAWSNLRLPVPAATSPAGLPSVEWAADHRAARAGVAAQVCLLVEFCLHVTRGHWREMLLERPNDAVAGDANDRPALCEDTNTLLEQLGWSESDAAAMVRYLRGWVDLPVVLMDDEEEEEED